MQACAHLCEERDEGCGFLLGISKPVPQLSSMRVFTPPFPAGMASATPKGRRQAQVFGTPISGLRPALEDRTNESPAPPQPFGSAFGKGSNAKAATPKRSAAKGPRGASPRAAQATGPAEEVAGESPEASAEELLRSEVSRIMAGLPEIMETPVLAKRKVQSKIVVTPQAHKGGPAQEGGQATERVSGGDSVQGPSGNAETKPEQRTLAGLCFSPTVSLAPTPANTPIAGVPVGSQRQAPHRSLNNDAVSASLNALAATRAASEAANVSVAAAGPTAGVAPGSGAAAVAGASGGLRSSASRARKPPMPRSTRGSTPKASARLAAIRIATPIGKTPPPRASNANLHLAEVSLGFSTQHRLSFLLSLGRVSCRPLAAELVDRLVKSITVVLSECKGLTEHFCLRSNRW